MFITFQILLACTSEIDNFILSSEGLLHETLISENFSNSKVVRGLKLSKKSLYLSKTKKIKKADVIFVMYLIQLLKNLN